MGAALAPHRETSGPGDVPRAAVIAGITLAAVVAVSGIAPHDRGIWLAENVLTLFVACWLALTARSFPLSTVSYTLLLGFLVLHEFGAHFTYPRVPYDRVVAEWTGISVDRALRLERNHWDRIVHAAFGAAFAVPLREVALRIAAVRGFWSFALPLGAVLSIGLAYEFAEWAVAVSWGVGPASAFLGAQGDPWDAHHDLLLAGLAAAMSLGVIAAVEFRRDRTAFVHDWRESVRVKAPVGGVPVAPATAPISAGSRRAPAPGDRGPAVARGDVSRAYPSA
jgi:putative membrane protein